MSSIDNSSPRKPAANGLWRRFDQFWFRTASPFDLAFCRILFFFLVFIFHIRQDISGWAMVPKSNWTPVWLFKVLHLGVLSEQHLRWMMLAWQAVLVLSCIGFLTRFSTITATILGTYVLGIAQNFGKVGHGNPVLIFTMMIFALSHCGDALSVDAFIRDKRSRPRPPNSGEYTWPISMACVLLMMVFCAAGCTKLVRSGLAWITSDNLRILLLQHQYALKNPPTNLGMMLARHPMLCHFMAAMTIGVELAAPLALLSRRIAWVLIPSLFLMQIGIGLVMGVYFTQFMISYLFWIPWEKVFAWFIRLSRRSPGIAATNPA